MAWTKLNSEEIYVLPNPVTIHNPGLIYTQSSGLGSYIHMLYVKRNLRKESPLHYNHLNV